MKYISVLSMPLSDEVFRRNVFVTIELTRFVR